MIDFNSFEGQRARIVELEIRLEKARLENLANLRLQGQLAVLEKALDKERLDHGYNRQQNLATIRRLSTILREATEFIDRHSEAWYTSGQALLAKCREAVGDSSGVRNRPREIILGDLLTWDLDEDRNVVNQADYEAWCHASIHWFR